MFKDLEYGIKKTFKGVDTNSIKNEVLRRCVTLITLLVVSNVFNLTLPAWFILGVIFIDYVAALIVSSIIIGLVLIIVSLAGLVIVLEYIIDITEDNLYKLRKRFK
jgi:hypothetical protein